MTPPIEPGGSVPGRGTGAASGGATTQRPAEDLRNQATAEASARTEELRESTAHKAETIAASIDAAARELSRDDIGHMSEYVSELADQLRHVSGTLREKSGDELLRDVGQLAREKPAVFLAGAVAIGFGLGRFARASQRPHRNERDQLPVPAGEARAHVAPAHVAPAHATAPATSAGTAAGTGPAATSGQNTGVAGTTLGTGAATPGTTTGGTTP